MSLFGRGGKTLTGLDVGASSVKIVSGSYKKSTFMVDRLVIIELPYRTIDERGIVNIEVVAEAVRTGLRELNQKSPQVATSVKGGGVLTKRITIPKLPIKEIPDQVRWEAEQVFPQDISTILVDHVLLGEGNNVPGAPANTKGWDLLLIGVREEDAMALANVIEDGKGTLRYMDLDQFAVGDFLQNLVKIPAGEAVAFVDVGASATRVSVRLNGSSIFLREFAVGGNAFTEAIATSLGLSFENAEGLKIQPEGGMPHEAMEAMHGVFQQWKGEIQQCEDIFVTQSSSALIGKWYVFGGASRTPGLLETLRDERFADKVFLLPIQELMRPKGKHIDPNLLNTWASRLVTAAALSCRKG